MNFLRNLLWVVVAVFLAIFANRNWNDVTLSLWSDIQADVKLPFLLLLTFLVGFLPPYFLMRSRIWSLKRKLVLAERSAAVVPPARPPEDGEEELA